MLGMRRAEPDGVRGATMRQLSSAFVILIVVAMIATFAVGSIFTIIQANSVLQQSIGDAENLAFIDSMDDCDLFDSSTCL